MLNRLNAQFASVFGLIGMFVIAFVLGEFLLGTEKVGASLTNSGLEKAAYLSGALGLIMGLFTYSILSNARTFYDANIMVIAQWITVGQIVIASQLFIVTVLFPEIVREGKGSVRGLYFILEWVVIVVPTALTVALANVKVFRIAPTPDNLEK